MRGVCITYVADVVDIVLRWHICAFCVSVACFVSVLVYALRVVCYMLC